MMNDTHVITYPYYQVKMAEKEDREEGKQVTSPVFMQGSTFKTSWDVRPTSPFYPPFILPNYYTLSVTK